MNELELNIEIATNLYPDASLIEQYGAKGSKIIVVNDSVELFSGGVDYCNNWNDLIPLIIDHNVQYQLNEQSTAREMAELLLRTLREA